MATEKIRVLSTKKLPVAFLEQASKRDILIDEAPLITITAREDIDEAVKAFEIASHVVFSSSSAAKALLSLNPKFNSAEKKIYCVGRKTADMFDGMEVVSANNAAALTELIINESPVEIAYFRGNRSLDIIKSELKKQSIPVSDFVVYDTHLKKLELDLYPYHYLWFFSPSGIESFLASNRLNASVTCVCIGKTTAAYLDVKNCLISEKPELASMLDCTLNNHYSNDNV